MTSRPNKTSKKGADPEIPLLLAKPKKNHTWPMLAAVAGVLLLVLLALSYTVFPRQMAAPLPWLLGLVVGVLAAGVYLLATHPVKDDELLERLRRGQHQDFGKALRHEKKEPTVNLPLIGETTLRRLAAAGILVAVTAWWLTPWAPIKVRARALEDLAVPLGEEIMAVVLVQPDAELAVAQPPSLPRSAISEARRVPPTAGVYPRALKALVEQRFDDARTLLADAEKGAPAEAAAKDDVPRWKFLVVEGQVEMFAGRFLEAAKHFESARQARPDEPSVLCQAAVAWLHAGHFEQADALAARAATVAQGKSATADVALATAQHIQAAVDAVRGEELEKAEKLNIEAESIFEQKLGESHPAAVASQNNQAIVFSLLARYPRADNNHIMACGNWSRSLDAWHPYLLASRTSTALLYAIQGHYADSAKIENELTASLEKIPPAERPPLGMLENVTALTQLGMADYGAAGPQAAQAFADLERQFGTEHFVLASALRTMADHDVAVALYAKAERYFLRAVELAEKGLGTEHPYLADTLLELAALYLLENRVDDADRRIQQAMEIIKKSAADDHPAVARGLWLRGQLEVRRQQESQARKSLEEARSIFRKTFPNGHPDLAAVEADLAPLDASAKDGLARLDRAIELTEQFLGKEHPAVADLLIARTRLLLKTGAWADADRPLNRAMTLRKKTLVPYDPRLAETIELKIRLLQAQKKAGTEEQIAALTEQARAIRKQHAENNRLD